MKRPRRAVPWLVAAALVASGLALSRRPASSGPNVVVIVASGVGTRLGCYGGPAATPNLDRLAALGRRFEWTYAQYPLSEASLLSLITGRRPESSQIFSAARGDLGGATPLQERFGKAGYQTILAGSLFGGDAEVHLRFDVVMGLSDADDPAHRAAAALESGGDAPLFLVLSLSRTPALPALMARHPPPAGPMPPERAWGDLPEIAVLPTRVEGPGGTLHPPPLAPDARHGLWAAAASRAAFVDAQVGLVLGALDRSRLWDRTIVVFASDTGTYLGGRGDAQRRDLLFEETLRTSLIVAAPGMQKPGIAASSLAELLDVYPTLLDRAGLVRDPAAEGASLVPALVDPKAVVKRAAVSVALRDAGRLGRSVRTARYRYTCWPDGSEELYDHDRDPSEFHNRAADPASASTLRSMRTWLDRDRQGRAHRAAAPPGSKGASRRPNVLLVILDDLSVRLGSYGYPVRTPNIDRLAALGRRFERAYAQVPMCSPSRMTLMTGWGARRLQVWSNATDPWPKAAGATLLQELFRRNGYYTARLGKVYHGRWNRGASWDLSEDDVGSPAPIMEEEPPPEGTVERFWRATDDDDADLPDGRRVRRAAELLSRARDRPFFIAVGIAKPHLRWVAPRKYFDLYSPQGIVLPPEPPDDRQDVPLIAVTNSPLEFPGETLGGIPPDFGERDRRRAIAAHYACVSFADAQVGVLLDALDRSRLWDDTIVVLLGDHGFHLGEHGLWRKDTLFEESVHTPLIVVAPGMPSRGSATRGLVDLTDVYPTLADLAGIPAPAGLEGTSLRPLLDDAGGPGKPAVMSFRRSEAPRLGRSLRTEGYRFTEWPDGSRELYDLASDPGEGVNLAADPRFVATVERLQRLLHAMARRAADVPRRAPRAGGGGGR